MKKIFKISKINIYIFGILANILPLIGLGIIGWGNFSKLNHYQLWAWIAGAIYYIFMWTIALSLWKKFDNSKKEIEAYQTRLEELEKRITNLEK